jgi:hypothetical protein
MSILIEAVKVCNVGNLTKVRSADSYTIRAIGQDDFSDIPIPDAPVQSGASVGSTGTKAVPK